MHWPFCTRLCPYCDFNIYKNKPKLASQLSEAICDDLVSWREASGPRSLVSLHFGGGTPSLMKPEHMRAIIETVRELWSPQDDMEIGLEANPGDVTTETLLQWRALGIERLSIGVQSFDDRVLQFLGRNHDSATAIGALKAAVDIMPRVSADLIYGWAGQSLDHWKDELKTALSFETEHISAYQLTIEEKTAFARAERRGEARAVDSDTSADLFEYVGEVLGGVGYHRYEISNFAKTQQDQSRHNKLYWQGQDYVGVGPGAHGRLTVDGVKTATVTTLKPQDYIDLGNAFGSSLTSREIMGNMARAEEYVLMGLRISEGISTNGFRELSGHALSLETIAHLTQDGLIIHDGDRITATQSGRLVLDSVSHALLAGL